MAKRRLREILVTVQGNDRDLSVTHEAYHELERMKERYVLPPEYYPVLVSTAHRVGLESITVLEDAEEGVRKYPDEPTLMQVLGMVYSESGYPLLGRDLLKRVLNIAADTSSSGTSLGTISPRDEKYARRVIAEIEAEMPLLLQHTNLSWPADEEIAYTSEFVRRATESGRFEEAVSEAQALLEKHPDQNYVRNNLARALWELGQWDEAITEQAEALRRDPDRLAGLANMVRFCLLANRREEANRWRRHASAISAKNPHDLFFWLEIAALFGDDQEILHIADRYGTEEGFRGTNVYGQAMVFFGTACARTGDQSGAVRWWNRAAGFRNARTLAEMHLEELDRPEDDRNDHWYFSFMHHMPRRFNEQIAAWGQPTGSDEEYITELLNHYPQIVGSARYLLQAGDDMGRHFGLILAAHTNDESLAPEVARLVTDNVLRTERKNQAMEFLAEYGGKPPEEARTVRVHSFEISREPTEKFPPEVEHLATEAYHLLNQGDGAGAERLLREARKKRDDLPSISHNLGYAYEMQGKTDEARQLLDETYQRFPDYVFARLAIAVRMVQEKDRTKEALALLRPIMARKTFHVSEFTALCHAMVLIHMRNEEFDAALRWLDWWKEVEPEDSRLEKLFIMDGWRAIKTLTGKSRKPKTRKRRKK